MNHAHTHNSADAHGALRLVPGYRSEADAPAREVVAVYARQAGELAEMVTAAMTVERDRHMAAMRSLRAVEVALAEQVDQLAALATHLDGGVR